ncbi:MAG: metalloregulator ArsR/SmtB family transcription factor [Acidilobaceae archaeon]
MEIAFEGLAKFFKLLSDPTRLKILMYIMALGPTSPLKISQDLGKSTNLVSYHLGFLSRIGLVSKKRQGKRVLYTLSDKEFEKLLSLLADYFKRKSSMDSLQFRRFRSNSSGGRV